MVLNDIFKNKECNYTLFSVNAIKAIEDAIVVNTDTSVPSPPPIIH